MHPILANRRLLGIYLAVWAPLALLLAMLFASAGPAPWKEALAVMPEPDKADAGDHLMLTALQVRDHFGSIHKVLRFAENAAPDAHLGIGADDERVGVFLRHDSGLAIGIQQAGFDRRQMLGLKFVHMTGNDFELADDLPQ